MKRSLVVLLTLVVLASVILSACGPSTPAATEPAAVETETVVEAEPTEAPTVEPTAVVETPTEEPTVEPTAEPTTDPEAVDENGRKSIALSTGFTMKYLETGPEDGEVIIFLHGITDSSHSWSSTAPFLSDTYHMYLLDQRGHGDSEQPAGGFTIPQFAEDVIAFMDAKGIEKAVIAGHSMGSFVAHQIASVYPERVSKLVLVATAPTSVGNEALLAAWETVGAPEFTDPIDPAFIEAWQTGPNPVEEQFFAGVLAATAKPSARVWKAAFRGLLTDDHSAFLADITAPTLIIWGELDSIFLQADQDAIKELMPEAKFVSYPDTGHNVQWEQPEKVANDIRAFLAE